MSKTRNYPVFSGSTAKETIEKIHEIATNREAKRRVLQSIKRIERRKGKKVLKI